MRRRIVSEPRDYEPWPVESVVEEGEAEAKDCTPNPGEHRAPPAEAAARAAKNAP